MTAQDLLDEVAEHFDTWGALWAGDELAKRVREARFKKGGA